ncbi:MAG: hypothetical protein HYS57_01025 [Parcubacteria group bacterium]|nr:hypothetical protein [Parcubacteria group bacterium]
MAKIVSVFDNRDSRIEHVLRLERMIEATDLNSAEKLHDCSRALMSDIKLTKGLAVTAARPFLHYEVTHMLAFEKWTATTIAGFAGDFLGVPRLCAVVRRRPHSPSLDILLKPARFDQTIPVFLSRDVFLGGGRVVAMDDFVDSGETMLKLKFLAEQAGAEVLGCGIFAARSSGYDRLVNGYFDQGLGIHLNGFGKKAKVLVVFE